jgi:hypothetical protein
LTAAGRAALAQALAIWRREHPAYEASLGASGVDADALRGMLRVMG